jgi:probable phosphoglycerate mutase
MEKIIYLVRHGETDYNARRIVQGSGVDVSLNEKGREQAHRFYQTYQEFDFDLLVTSTLKRSIESMQWFERQVPLVHRDPRINEISWGESEGKEGTPESIKAYKEVVRHWGEGNLDVGLPGGETGAELIKRVDDFISWVNGRREERLLICSHGRTMRCLLSRFLQLPVRAMEDFQHHNLGLFELIGGDGYRLVRQNDIKHLY